MLCVFIVIFENVGLNKNLKKYDRLFLFVYYFNLRFPVLFVGSLQMWKLLKLMIFALHKYSLREAGKQVLNTICKNNVKNNFSCSFGCKNKKGELSAAILEKFLAAVLERWASILGGERVKSFIWPNSQLAAAKLYQNCPLDNHKKTSTKYPFPINLIYMCFTFTLYFILPESCWEIQAR